VCRKRLFHLKRLRGSGVSDAITAQATEQHAVSVRQQTKKGTKALKPLRAIKETIYLHVKNCRRNQETLVF